MSVACPDCGAAPGFGCKRGVSGHRVAGPHAGRLELVEGGNWSAWVPADQPGLFCADDPEQAQLAV